MEAEPEALFAGDLVEVKSCDDGFEGCWCEAVVSKQVGRLGSKLQGDAQSTRMYEVRYTRFRGARGKAMPTVKVQPTMHESAIIYC